LKPPHPQEYFQSLRFDIFHLLKVIAMQMLFFGTDILQNFRHCEIFSTTLQQFDTFCDIICDASLAALYSNQNQVKNS